MRDPEADYAKLFPPPRHVEKQIFCAQQKPGLADYLTTAQKPRLDANVFSALPNRFADSRFLQIMGARRSPCNSPRKKVTLLHNAAKSHAIHHMHLASPPPPALASPALALGLLADKNQ